MKFYTKRSFISLTDNGEPVCVHPWRLTSIPHGAVDPAGSTAGALLHSAQAAGDTELPDQVRKE